MAAELKDLRAKVTAHTWCFLEAEARATGRDQAELVREILGQWAQQRHQAASVAQRLLAAEGEPGIGGGITGNLRERAA
jgi:hypothetical protein